MIALDTVAACPWHEPGGVAAAQVICAFLDDIGIGFKVRKIDGTMFLAGLAVIDAGILIDPDIASWPGDLLHEAGHIAMASPDRRATGISDDPAEEMTAIAWSVAAARHCGLPLAVLFHPQGYKGGSQSLIENFEEGRTFGVPLLACYGMTSEEAYPQMRRWLR